MFATYVGTVIAHKTRHNPRQKMYTSFKCSKFTRSKHTYNTNS